MTIPGRYAAPYSAARDSTTPTADPKHRRPKHRGTWDEHDRRVAETGRRKDGVPVLGGNCTDCNPRGEHKRKAA